jgi:putative SOS response-associated peptidase YedK
MCNRYKMTAERAALLARYGVDAYGEHGRLPEPELFPKRLAWVIRNTDAGRLVEPMAWGFPHTVTGKSGKPIEKPVTNVRNLASPFWRSALNAPARRCLVPFTSFSEYGSVRGPDGKLPLHWFDLPSRPIASFAGIWRPSDAGPVFAFLTTEPNAIVAPIHPKAMPVVLHDEDEERWLTADVADALDLAAPFPAQLMRVE